ncbi:hypothetical protein HLB23_17655 [Nocardia uniformis]|uniref:Uncharacterized protein n=1 Tax=Nocardia uniformis TaxID=53432 RepID=A0A849BZC3_9NOCA|nr:hypothetical protein [Nocardia uniformis]NNH71664.1 hypothetical protein [Nocardia uniformis]
MTLEEIAGELYGVAPAGFVAARDEWVRRARADGDRELAAAIGKLRRPTVAAWAVNLLVRQAHEEVGALLELGDALRDAQRRLSGDRLRTLTTQRQQVVNALTRKAGELAPDHGQPLSETVLREVGQTLHAALADPEVANQVRAGTLTSATTYEGFGPASLMSVPDRPATRGKSSARDRASAHATAAGADTTAVGADAAADESDAAAPTSTSRSARRDARTTKSRSRTSESADRPDPQAQTRQELTEALEALQSARAARDSARSEHDRTTSDLATIEARISALREDLSHAETERRFTVAANRTANEALTKAQRHLDHVERWAEKVRTRLSPS